MNPHLSTEQRPNNVANDSTYRVLILGDFHYGESYGRAGAQILAREGYAFSTEYLQPFIDTSDAFILNLETPLAKEEEFPSPLRGRKSYIHWADPDGSGKALASLGVDAVSLANNHTVDLGHQALNASFDTLETLGIPWFGAGRTRSEAEGPYRLSLPEHVGGGVIGFYGSFQYSQSHDQEFQFYATDQSPGCAQISATSVVSPADHERRQDTFHLAFPHWGANYAWRTPGQKRLANQLTSAGYHLVLGHGSHAVQEIHRRGGQWVAYGIGNGNFQSGGRWKKFEERNGIVPFSFWTVLEVTRSESGNRRVSVNLYPVYSDNSATGFQPRPVSSEDFDLVTKALTERAEPTGSFPGEHMSFSSDELGYCIRLEIADWPTGEVPIPLRQKTVDLEREAVLAELYAVDVVTSGDAERTAAEVSKNFPYIVTDEPNTYDDPDSQSVIRDQVEGRRNIGALVISRAAARHGAEVKWHGGYSAVLSKDNRDVLIRGHMCTDTAVSAQIVKDKLLAKQLLQESEVATPSGALAEDPSMAVEIQQHLGCPVVVKPRFGHKGEGITVGISEPEDIEEAFQRASADGRGVLVEEFIDGVEFRLLASNEESFGAIRRMLPHVAGNGTSTISELIEQKNDLRRRNPNNSMLMIPMDDVMVGHLRRQGLTLNDVLAEGERVIVRNVGGISGGGEAQECLDEVGEDVRSLAVASVAAIPSMNWGGADILLSRRTGRPYLLELNTNAAISNSTYPVYGQPKDVGEVAWKRMFAASYSDTEPIGSAEPNTSAAPVADELRDLGVEPTAPTSLTNLFRSYLKSHDWTVTSFAGRADKMRSPTGIEKWFYGCIDDKLLSTASSVLRAHRTVRTIQRDRSVDMPRATRIRSVRELADFASRAGEPIVIVPWAQGWGARRFPTETELSPGEVAGDASLNVLAQRRPEGQRFRVFASRARSLSVLAEGPPIAGSNVSIAHVGKAAVEAVRAVPGLRWAAVDIVLPKTVHSAPLVEGLRMEASFDGNEVVLAGSMQTTFDTIADEEMAVGVSPDSLDGKTPNTFVDAASSELIRQNAELRRNLGALTISQAAEQQGASLDWLSKRDVWAVFHDRRVAMTGHYGTESVLANRIVGDKQIAKDIMSAAGVSVPAGRRVTSVEDALQAQGEIGGPVVVKPANGAMGRGVTVNVTAPEDVSEAFRRARTSGGAVLIEQYVHGSEYRAHATPEECVGVFRRLLPSVIGNGESTVTELVKRKNKLRKLNPTTSQQPIPMDDVAEGFLGRRGLNWDSIVPLGQRVVVRDVNGLTSGGDSEECFDSVDDSLKRTAAAAIAAIPGMDWGGVDILVEESTGASFVVEINTDAAINGSTFPVFGKPRDLGGVLWRQMYNRSNPDSTQAPETLAPNQAPRRMETVHPGSGNEPFTLQDLLKGELSRRGDRIIDHNSRIWSAEDDRGARLWFSTVLSGNDRLTSLRHLFRRVQLRQALRRMHVPRPTGQPYSGVEQLRGFRHEVGAAVVLLPLNTEGKKMPLTPISIDDPINETVLADQTSGFAQVYRPGLRFRIIATADRALMVTAPAGQPVPDDPIVERVSKLAVFAVRAVPQLRWAVIDIMHRFPEDMVTGEVNDVVEDMCVDPMFVPQDEIVAGSMESVLEMLITGASTQFIAQGSLPDYFGRSPGTSS